MLLHYHLLSSLFFQLWLECFGAWPYLNESSMHLWEWYWNQGVNKSKESFKQLLNIIGNPVFLPSAVLKTAWASINKHLGKNKFNGDLPEWLGDDEGGKCSSATILAPFHSWSRIPGPKNYTPPGFYHCPLVSITKEKISNPSHASFFHFEPHKLWWQPSHRDHDVNVHGELFTSTTFLKVHQALQNSPPEPRCTLPHVVAALMLASGKFWRDYNGLWSLADIICLLNLYSWPPLIAYLDP